MTAQAPARQPSVRLPRPGRLAGFRRSDGPWILLFLAPWIVGVIIFTAGPMLASLVLSFMDFGGFRAPEFIGLENYQRMATDPKVASSLGATVFYTALSVPLSMLIALGLATLLNQVGRAAGFFRTVFYLPDMTPAVAVGVIWLFLLNPQAGLINQALGALGLPRPGWTTDPDWVKPAIVLASLWTLGSTTVIYFAALRNVPRELYEAARIDGAGPWQQFRNITLPFISGALFFTLIVNTIFSLQVFDVAYTMFFGAGSPGISSSARFYSIYLFERAFRDLEFGYASALAWLLFAVILVITLLQLRLSRRWVYYEGE